jgi:hypothetical protein
MHLQVDLLFCTFKFRLKELSIFEIWNRRLGRFSYRLSYSSVVLCTYLRKLETSECTPTVLVAYYAHTKFSTQYHDCKLHQALVLNLELGTVLL